MWFAFVVWPREVRRSRRDFGDLDNKLDAILHKLWESKRREIGMSVQMDELVAAVEENTSLDDSIIEFLNGLVDQMLDVAGDKEKAVALAEEVRAKTVAVAAALAANTPAAPPE
jgi:predicted membrane chloride channel (bestrophin family)